MVQLFQENSWKIAHLHHCSLSHWDPLASFSNLISITLLPELLLSHYSVRVPLLCIALYVALTSRFLTLNFKVLHGFTHLLHYPFGRSHMRLFAPIDFHSLALQPFHHKGAHLDKHWREASQISSLPWALGSLKGTQMASYYHANLPRSTHGNRAPHF